MVICVNELEKDGWTDNSIVHHFNASLDISMSAVCPCESFFATKKTHIVLHLLLHCFHSQS